jgi:hypothetical protein
MACACQVPSFLRYQIINGPPGLSQALGTSCLYMGILVSTAPARPLRLLATAVWNGELGVRSAANALPASVTAAYVPVDQQFGTLVERQSRYGLGTTA